MISKFISEIKKKKTLSSLPDAFVKKLIENYFQKYPKLEKFLKDHPKPLKSKEFKLMMKDLRKTLHDVYGIFVLRDKNLRHLKEHLAEIKEIDEGALQIHMDLLSTHKSSLERLNFYYQIYGEIFKHTGKPKSILDLACGLNPLSFPYMGLKKVDYFASELTDFDSEFIQEYFDLMKSFGLNGKAFAMDLLHAKDLPKVDVCFLFKTLDSLEDIERNYSKELIKKIPAKFLVVSFPTMSIGGKNPIKQRGWFFRIMRELGYKAETFEIENEVFYIIKNK
ncbi:MAG: hypothetical protein KKA79_00150 [Nanoarchaeota archaeon]|nr:hypothetical protein [Nanoarchaeota archaeon]MCG2718408.1 hypothetical protein [Nanoarchaeota archaeon]